MRIYLAEDAALIRAGIRQILQSAGHTIVGTAADAPTLRHGITRLASTGQLPDLLIADVRMPPGDTDDGLRAAIDLRRQHPELPVLVLSAYISRPYAATLLTGNSTAGVGYLLKERVGRVDEFLNAISIVRAGGMVIDPHVARQALHGQLPEPLDRLTPREQEVLALMATGQSNTQIAEQLHLSPQAISKHITSIFTKLDLPPELDNRRVLAILTWLNAL